MKSVKPLDGKGLQPGSAGNPGTKRVVWTMVAGAGALAGLFAVTLTVPVPQPAVLTLMVLKALAAAAVVQGLTGHLDIAGTIGKWTVKAGGPLAVALAVGYVDYTFIPPAKAPEIASEKEAEPPPADPTRINSPKVKEIDGSFRQKAGSVSGGLPPGAQVNSPTIGKVKHDFDLTVGDVVLGAGPGGAPVPPGH